MCPLTPCLTPTTHLPRGRRTVGARPLSWAPIQGYVPSNSAGGMGAVRAPMCPLTPCMTTLHHVPRTRRTEGARPLSWAPKRGHIQSNPGGEGCSTGPHVPSNPLHDPVAPRAKDTTNRGSAPLVMGPQAGPCSIHSRGGEGSGTGPHVPSNPMHNPNDPRAKGKTHGGSAPLVMGPQAGPCSIQFTGGMGAVGAPVCPLTQCMTLLHHVPRTRRTEEARLLSSHNVTQIAFHYFFAVALPLPLPLPPPFLGVGGAGFRI